MRPFFVVGLLGAASALRCGGGPRAAARAPSALSAAAPDRRRSAFAPSQSRPDTALAATNAESEPQGSLVLAAASTLAAAAFGAGIWYTMGATSGLEFAAGYIVEQSLSVDNLLVFLVLFDYFKVPAGPMQDKALAFGLYGAVVCRAIFVLLGAAVLESFKPVLLVFAALLIFTSGKILFAGDDEEDEDPAENAIVKFVMGQNVVPSTDAFDREDATKFFTECADGIKRATPLLTCVVCLELSDIVFAVDSVPAVFGVTRDPLIVYSSNLFAILGLRAWFGVLSKAAEELVYLEKSVALVLGFVGGKMVGSFFGYDISTAQSLGVVVSTLAAGVALSVLAPPETDDES